LTAEAAAETIPEPREEGEAGGRWTSSCGFPPTRGAGADIVAVVVVRAVVGVGKRRGREGRRRKERREENRHTLANPHSRFSSFFPGERKRERIIVATREERIECSASEITVVVSESRRFFRRIACFRLEPGGGGFRELEGDD
jgi:hypothetical protein